MAFVAAAAGLSTVALSSSHEAKPSVSMSGPTMPTSETTSAVAPPPVEASPTFFVSDLPNAPGAPDGPARADHSPRGPRAAATTVAETAHDAPLQEGPSLREEIEALERARRALSDRHCAQARRALTDYRARFPNGRLEREADVVDVEITGRSGDVAHARAAARRFVSRFPDSPYAMRLTPWLGDEGSEINVTSCSDTTP